MNTLSLQPSQILCLEHGTMSLYAELIQVIQTRQNCWVRPLLLKQTRAIALSPHAGQRSGLEEPLDSAVLYDLRQGADLICPIALFRPAFDTELVPLLMQLEQSGSTDEDADKASETCHLAHQKLRSLIHQIWQAQPEAFSPNLSQI